MKLWKTVAIDINMYLMFILNFKHSLGPAKVIEQFLSLLHQVASTNCNLTKNKQLPYYNQMSHIHCHIHRQIFQQSLSTFTCIWEPGLEKRHALVVWHWTGSQNQTTSSISISQFAKAIILLLALSQFQPGCCWQTVCMSRMTDSHTQQKKGCIEKTKTNYMSLYVL